MPNYPFRAPPALLARLPWDDAAHPVVRQFLPSAEERCSVPGYVTDPLREAEALAAPGLLIKYAGRALLLVSGQCAVHCRFCFRRHAPVGSPPADWQPALTALAADPTLREVILSGGDPLMLGDAALAALAGELAAIPHLRCLRLHSRMPVLTPERVGRPLLDWLTGTRLTPVVVVHVNHPEELDPAARAALRRLVGAGIPVYAQSVLLRGVNDRVEVLVELYETLLDCRVTPYYLHLLDPVAGAAHFAVGEAEGAALLAAARTRLPGYGTPRLVREEPGRPGKTVLA